MRIELLVKAIDAYLNHNYSDATDVELKTLIGDLTELLKEANVRLVKIDMDSRERKRRNVVAARMRRAEREADERERVEKIKKDVEALRMQFDAGVQTIGTAAHYAKLDIFYASGILAHYAPELLKEMK